MTNFIIPSERINRLSDLNLELLDALTTTLIWIREYCNKHNIPLFNEDSLYRLIIFSRKVIKEINEIEELIIKSRKLPPTIDVEALCKKHGAEINY